MNINSIVRLDLSPSHIITREPECNGADKSVDKWTDLALE